MIEKGCSISHTRMHASLLGKVCEDECAFLWEQLVLLHSELLQELASGHSEDGLEQAASEHLSGFIAREAVVTLGDVAVAQPPEGEILLSYKISASATIS